MGWIIFFICVVLVLTYFMFAPFFIEIDSNRERYELIFHKLAKVGLIFNRDSTIYLEIKILNWQKRIDLLKRKGKKEIKRKPRKENNRISMLTVKCILRSFKINELYLSMDTGSMPVNGILYPALYLIGYRTGKNISINFIGENILVIQIENNMARIVWAFIKSTLQQSYSHHKIKSN